MIYMMVFSTIHMKWYVCFTHIDMLLTFTEAASERLRKAEEAKAAAAAKREAQLQATKAAQAKKTVSQSKPGGTISLFGGGTQAVSKKAPQAATPAATKAAPKKQPAKKAGGSFGFFGNAPAPKKAPPAQVVVEEKKPVQKSPTFSLFGGAPAKKASSPKVVEKKQPAKKPVVEKKQPAKKAAGGFGGLFGAAPAKKASVNDNIPALARFKQNPDGSITGTISNSKSFRNGTVITTSPVPKGIKPGMVVKTSSGSQYRLQ